MDHVLFLTVYLFLIVCLFLYILAVPEWQNILNVSHYVAVAQENRNNSYDNNKKKKEYDKMIQAPFSWWSSVLLYCHPLRKKNVFELNHFTEESTFCTNGTILCVCSHIIIQCISILQVLQACVQDKNSYMCLMVMLPIQHININMKHQCTNSHREIYWYWLL